MQQSSSTKLIKFTKREIEFIKAFPENEFSLEKIADSLVISKNTVRTHLYNIYGKLCISNQAALIYNAIKLGIIKVEEEE